MSQLRIPIVIISTALLCSACAGAPGEELPASSSAPSATASSTVTASVATPIDGTWTTGELTASQVLSHLKDKNLDQWTDDLMRIDGITDDDTKVAYTVKLDNGVLTLTGKVGDAPPERYDHARYTVSGDQFAITTEDGTCTATFTWSAGGDDLRLALTDDNCPTADGVPDEVWMRAYYEASPLSRVP